MKRAIYLGLLAALGAVGCKDKNSIPDDTDTGDIDDTGDTNDTDTDDTNPDTDTPPPCEISFLAIDSEPLSSEADWYYRDPARLFFSDAAETQATITVADSMGAEIPVTVEWNEAGTVATVAPESGVWTASAAHTLTVDICDETSEIAFTTSEYGAAMTVTPDDLVGRVYYIDMSQAEYTEPAGIGVLLSLYLDQPLLIGVMAATDDAIELMGAQGMVDKGSGTISQDTDYLTWAFGSADFTGAPFFSAVSTTTIFDVGEEIPVYDFRFEGTFSPDGARIGGGRVRGLGDTRNMGPLLEQGEEPEAVCEFLAKAGLNCEECPDGNFYCLTIAGEFEDADWQEGLTLVPVTE